MTSTFDNILHRAEKLSSSIRCQKSDSVVSSTDINSRVNTAVDDIFREIESLWQHKRASDEKIAEIEANLLLGENSISLGTLTKKVQQDVVREKEQDEQLNTNIATAECTNLLQDLIDTSSERAKLEAERTFLNQKIVDAAHQSSRSFIHSNPPDQTSPKQRVDRRVVQQSPLSPLELRFAETLSEYILDKNCSELACSLVEASTVARDDAILSLWEQVVSLVDSNIACDKKTEQFRSSPAWMTHVIENSVEYLQKHFVSHMSQVVERNLETAKRGGVPSTLSLIDAYLNVRHQSCGKPNSQDAVFGPNNHGLWEVLYYCLRCGDFDAVRLVIHSLQNIPTNAALVIALSAVCETKKLQMEARTKLKAEWRSEARNCTDPHKRAVYCCLLGGDVPEVCDNLENWLWLKLASCRFDAALSPAVFKELQKLISIDFGEDYFTSDGGSPLIFFQALWLTGQLERAINVLYGADLLVHAVHIAILAHLNGFLLISSDMGEPVLTLSVAEPLECSLNFARLLLLYVKNFECTDIQRSLDYYYFLNGLKSPVGGNLFYACVSRAVYLSGDIQRIIGTLDDHGIRHSGLLDKYSSDISMDDAIAKVASDTELSGNTVDSIHLYHMANHCDDAVRLTCNLLATQITSNGELVEARNLAVWLADIYKQSTSSCSCDSRATLCLLIDLATFFEHYRRDRFDSCMEILNRIKCVPLHPDDVQSFVSAFHMLADQVRSVLPDLCLAIMKLLVDECSRCPQSIEELRLRAKAIIVYSAMIPYRFPSQITTQILQLNSQLS